MNSQSHSITMTRSVQRELLAWLSGSDQERGCLIGASRAMDRLDRWVPVPGHGEPGRFVPDMEALNQQIHLWAGEGICFRGMIHSHPGGALMPSEADLQAMTRWTEASGLPDLCFGIAAEQDGHWRLALWRAAGTPAQITQLRQIPTFRPLAGTKWRYNV